MGIKELIKLFEKKFPDRKVIHAGQYKNGFLFVAPDKELGEFNDTTNPIFFISKDGKEIDRRSPVDEPYGISNSLMDEHRLF